MGPLGRLFIIFDAWEAADCADGRALLMRSPRIDSRLVHTRRGATAAGADVFRGMIALDVIGMFDNRRALLSLFFYCIA